MATGAATTTTESALLRVQHQKTLNWRGVAQAKFWNMVSKDHNFTGRHKERVVPLTAGNSGSSNFSVALSNRGPGTNATFTLTKKNDFVILSVAEEFFEAKNIDAIKNIIVDQLDRKGWEHGMMISRRTWSENGSALGRLKSSGAITTTTITLENAYQAWNFEPGMICQFADNAGTGASPTAARTGTLTVSTRDPAAGTVTFTANVTTGIPAATNSDYVFLEGEHTFSWSGILGWTPVAAPSDTFLGYDRSAASNINRVSGYRPSAVRSDKGSNVGTALAQFVRAGVDVNTLFINPIPYQEWMDELGNHRESITVNAKTVGVNFKGILYHTPAGDVTVLSDPLCPENVWLGTNMDNWQILAQGQIPSMPGPNDWKLESNDDARQGRLISRCCLDCVDPGSVVIGTWS